MKIQDRLKIVTKYLIGKGVASNQKALGKLLGYKNESSFSQILNQKVPINDIFLSKLLEVSPDLNITWITSGEGQMLKINEAIDRGPLTSAFEEVFTTKSGNTYEVIDENNYRLHIRKVSQRAYAGYMSGWSDPEFIETLPFTTVTVNEFHQGEYRVFEVSGDSMDYEGKNAIVEGDNVIARQVDRDHWKSKLHIKRWNEWVIVHDEGIIVKHISFHDVENGVITCKSYNVNKTLYPDFELSLEKVYEIYNVVKVERSR